MSANDSELICTEDINSKEALTQSLTDWTKVNDLIKEYEGLIKELKQKKLDLQQRNVEFMKVNDLDSIEINGGTQVSLVMTRSKVSNLTKTRLPGKLEEYFEKKKHYDRTKAENSVKDILDFLDEDPVYTESAYLRKYEPK